MRPITQPGIGFAQTHPLCSAERDLRLPLHVLDFGDQLAKIGTHDCCAPRRNFARA